MTTNNDVIRQCLQAISDQHDGKLTPSLVLRHARDENHPLHEFFDWDNDSAGQKYRIDQARRLIRSVRVVVTTEHRKVKAIAYVRDPTVDANQQGYIETARARGHEELTREILIQEFDRAGAALRRARKIADYLGMVEEIDAFLRELEVLRFRVTDNKNPTLHG